MVQVCPNSKLSYNRPVYLGLSVYGGVQKVLEFSTLVPFGSKIWVLDERPGQSKLAPKSRALPFMGFTESPGIFKYWDGCAILTTRNAMYTNAETPDTTKSAPTRLLEGEKRDLTPIDECDDLFELVERARTPDNTAETGTAGGDVEETPETNGESDGEALEDDAQAPGGVGESDDAPEIPEVPEGPKRSIRLAGKPRMDYRVMNNKGIDAARSAANAAISDEEDPRNVHEARRSNHAEEWNDSMERELAQLETRNTWSKTDLPIGRKSIGSTWVYLTKGDGTRKSRLVAQGFSQIPRYDFFDTHSPVVHDEGICLLMAICAALGWSLDQVDVVSAYLNGILPPEEEVYMRQPPGFDDGTSKVLRLHKAIYGLKQSGRIWNQQLNAYFVENGWIWLLSDQCIYARFRNDSTTAVAVHVGDMAIGSSKISEMDIAKREIGGRFECKDLGPISKIVGYEVTRDYAKRRIKLSQGEYIRKLLARFSMTDANPVATPLCPNTNLTMPDPDAKILHDIPYRELIGSLLYAATGTRPDISYAVG